MKLGLSVVSEARPRVLQTWYHGTCVECRCAIKPGDTVLYRPANPHMWHSKATVQHLDGQCPAIMDYSVQLMYRATSKRVTVRAFNAEEAITKATPKRTSRDVDLPCGFVVRQGNVEVLRRVAQ